VGAMNDLLGPEAVHALAGVLGEAGPGVDWTRLGGLAGELEELTLRGRADLIADALVADLRGAVVAPHAQYGAAADVVRRGLDGPRLTGWMVWPVGEAAVSLALEDAGEDAFDDCLALLAELTPRLTSEFAIRRLLRRDLDRSLSAIADWTAHPDEHVRRLASEGTRSYLPWAVRVPELLVRPEATLPLLDALRADPSDYVRRSVANHLNDLARHAPELVVATASRWMADADADTAWVVRHGLRTLVKKAHPGALAVMGFAPARVAVGPLELASAALVLPDELDFTCSVTNEAGEPARLAVDFVVHYVKASGARSAKVFKLTTLQLGPGESVRLRKRHAFRQMTTRVHYAGTHAVELQVNGARHGLVEFEVSV
jgi:3-methyladenine DNA glycosylase AlkC